MYYFAYGSNMSLEHMRRLCGWHFYVLGPAVLADFEFGPDTRGYANIRPAKGKNVHGVLYEVDQYCIDSLDKFEGYPEIFDRIEVTVVDPAGAKVVAWVYAEKPQEFGGSYIKEEYLKRVIAGATENHLPEEWIRFLNSFLSRSP